MASHRTAPRTDPTVSSVASSLAPGSTSGRTSSSSAGLTLPHAHLFHPSSAFVDGQPLPRLVVFDLDYTLWPFWVDTHVSPPLRLAPAAPPVSTTRSSMAPVTPSTASSSLAAIKAVDRVGDTFGFYDDVPELLHALPAAGVRMAVASRTAAPELARDLLRLLPVPAREHAPGSAGRLFKKSRQAHVHAPASAVTHGPDGPTRKAIDVFDGGLEMYPSSKLRHMEALQRRTGVAYEEMLFFDDESRNRDVETLGVTMWLVRDGVSWAELERGVREWRRRRGHTRVGKSVH